MTDIATHLATAKEEFAKHRVNKAVAALIQAVELLSGVEAPAPAEPVKQTLMEPAPAPEGTPVAETPPETTPAELARILATADLASSQEPAAKPAPRKRAPTGTRSSDV